MQSDIIPKNSADGDWMIQKLTPAVKALADCRNAVEAKQMVDIAHAAAVYAKRQKMGAKAILYAHGVRADAMRLLGKFLIESNVGPGQPKKKNGNCDAPFSNKLPAGITKRESSAAQFVAKLPEEKFQAFRVNKITLTKLRSTTPAHEADQYTFLEQILDSQGEAPDSPKASPKDQTHAVDLEIVESAPEKKDCVAQNKLPSAKPMKKASPAAKANDVGQDAPICCLCGKDFLQGDPWKQLAWHYEKHLDCLLRAAKTKEQLGEMLQIMGATKTQFPEWRKSQRYPSTK